jgi:hypothetical protein
MDIHSPLELRIQDHLGVRLYCTQGLALSCNLPPDPEPHICCHETIITRLWLWVIGCGGHRFETCQTRLDLECGAFLPARPIVVNWYLPTWQSITDHIPGESERKYAPDAALPVLALPVKSSYELVGSC